MIDEERSYEAFLRSRRAEILERMAAAARRAGRDASEVEAIAVSKTVGVEEVVDAIRAGWTRFGENRPQELGRKLEGLSGVPEADGVSFDMIGNLQKNKINQVIGRVRLIHSVSSAHLAEAISKRSEARGIASDALLEVNVSGEASKSGFSPDEVLGCAEGLAGLAGLRIRGLMAMAPAGDPDAARRTASASTVLETAMASTSCASRPARAAASAIRRRISRRRRARKYSYELGSSSYITRAPPLLPPS